MRATHIPLITFKRRSDGVCLATAWPETVRECPRQSSGFEQCGGPWGVATGGLARRAAGSPEYTSGVAGFLDRVFGTDVEESAELSRKEFLRAAKDEHDVVQGFLKHLLVVKLDLELTREHFVTQAR